MNARNISSLLLAGLLTLSCSEDTSSEAITGETQDMGTQGDQGGEDDAGTPDAGVDTTGQEDTGEDPGGACTSDADCDDGVFCNGTERCFQGECFESRRAQCEDYVLCTVDECDEGERLCDYVPSEEACEPGQVCDLKAGCFTPAECTNDEECDDELVCNGEEVCGRDGMCVPGVPPDCNDGVFCTVDECVEELGACQNVPDHTLCLPSEQCNIQEDCEDTPPCTTDDDCNDASFCNGEETCDTDSGDCLPGERPPVDDAVPCTIDSCSDQLGQVVHTPHTARCSDGEFCNGAEICHPTDGCRPGEPPVLSDGIGCTSDRCDEEADFVEHIPDHAPCDDGLFCNGTEVCHPVEGCSPGEPLDANDGVGCTIDTCSEVDGEILHVASDERCDDGLFCNGKEECDPVDDCQRDDPPVVNDEIDCTEDRCDEEADEVVHELIHARCSDDQFCNGTEFCTADGCTEGETPTLSDGVGCTIDRCEEDNDEITHTPNHQACQDQLWCNGSEVCDLELDCQPGTPQDISDGVECTDDECDEQNNRIINRVNHANCDDRLFCNGDETCDRRLDCQDGTPPALVDEDDTPCTEPVCDEDANEVVEIPRHEQCEDENICNGQERCRAVFGCVPGRNLDNGTVCQDNPRLVCIDGQCTDEPGGFEWDGLYDIEPDISYHCALSQLFNIYRVNYAFTHVDIDDVGGTRLRVTPDPGGPVTNITMEQRPTPPGPTFSVTQRLEGLCTETYTLTARFTDDDTFTGTFTRAFEPAAPELCSDCTDHSIQITGQRN